MNAPHKHETGGEVHKNEDYSEYSDRWWVCEGLKFIINETGGGAQAHALRRLGIVSKAGG